MAETIGYSIGLVERFLELLAEGGDAGASTALEHFRLIEQAYIQKRNEALTSKIKLDEIQLNLSGWKKIENGDV